jgi:hypothetical protein
VQAASKFGENLQFEMALLWENHYDARRNDTSNAQEYDDATGN